MRSDVAGGYDLSGFLAIAKNGVGLGRSSQFKGFGLIGIEPLDLPIVFVRGSSSHHLGLGRLENEEVVLHDVKMGIDYELIGFSIQSFVNG